MSISTYKLTVFVQLKIKPEPMPCSDMHILHRVDIPGWRRGGRDEFVVELLSGQQNSGGPGRGWFVGTRNLNNESIKTSTGVG